MDELKPFLDVYWGSLFSYNQTLRKRSDDEELFGSESLDDVMDFYLTTQALEYLKGVLMSHTGSPGMLLAARCFLEGLAIKRMYEEKQITDLQVDLLRHQVHLVEYRYYSKFNDIASQILIPEKLEEDYKKTIEFFRDKLSDNFSEKQIQAIVKSDVPFLCNPNIHFRDLVERFLGEHAAKMYGLFSQAIHPSVNDFYSIEGVWYTIPDLLLLIIEEFKSIPASKITFQGYCSLTTTSPMSRQYRDLVDQECTVLKGICKVFDSFFEKNYTSDTLTTIILLLQDTCSDKLLGFCEHVKSKWKIMLEICASYYACYTAWPDERHFKLVEEHERMQIKRNLKEEFSSEKAYEVYKSLYPNGVDYKSFEKGFQTTCGYTIDEKGRAKSLSQVVRKYIEHFASVGSITSWDRSMLLDYVESQMISHANGYMWYANSGSWGDITNIIIGSDLCILSILQAINTVFSLHKTAERNNVYKPILNVLRNGMKKLDTICQSKTSLLLVPGFSF